LWKYQRWISMAGTALPLALVGLAYLAAPLPAAPASEWALTQWFFSVIDVVVLHWTQVLTEAIGCAIAMLMKGPAFVADSLDVQHSDRPCSPTLDDMREQN
jgi:hypothetical protein